MKKINKINVSPIARV